MSIVTIFLGCILVLGLIALAAQARRAEVQWHTVWPTMLIIVAVGVIAVLTNEAITPNASYVQSIAHTMTMNLAWSGAGLIWLFAALLWFYNRTEKEVMQSASE